LATAHAGIAYWSGNSTTTTPAPSTAPTPSVSPVPSASPGPFGGSAVTPGGASPVKLEIENYDTGGEGKGYHDSATSNLGASQYRDNDPVGVKDESVSNGHAVGFFAVGEWLQYTTKIATAGMYTMNIHASNIASDATVAVTIDGKAVGTLAIPNTTAYTTFGDSPAISFSLTAGTHSIRLIAQSAATGYIGDLDYASMTTATTPSPTVTPTPTVSCAVVGDVTCDNHVNGADVAKLIAYWNTQSGATHSMGDLTGDGKVDGADIAKIISNWGI